MAVSLSQWSGGVGLLRCTDSDPESEHSDNLHMNFMQDDRNVLRIWRYGNQRSTFIKAESVVKSLLPEESLDDCDIEDRLHGPVAEIRVMKTMVFHNEDGKSARANTKQALPDILKMEMEMEIPST
ncbi:hypothetical protein Tco_0425031 [Tanacetum coccineum]